MKNSEREKVKLTHTETRGQKIDESKMNELRQIKKKYDEGAVAEDQLLSPFDRVLLSSFQKDRMQLERLIIITNQGRRIMGEKTYPKKKFKEHLEKLVSLDYLEHEEVEYEHKINQIYILTEKGKEESL